MAAVAKAQNPSSAPKQSAPAAEATLSSSATDRSKTWAPGIVHRFANGHLQRRPAGSSNSSPLIQAFTRISSPADAAEKEAESTASKIVSMPAPPGHGAAAVRLGADSVSRRPTGSLIQARPQPLGVMHPPPAALSALAKASGSIIQRQATARPGSAGSRASASIQASLSGGTPLPANLRGFMEPRFRADFGRVRIHTDEDAATLSRELSAEAFTYGNHIFFGKGRFQPDTREGMRLIAHELTHTIQQRAVIQRQEAVTVSEQAPVQVQRLGLSDALDYFADRANLIPGFRMFTIILGVNPINMSRVDRSAANILRAVVEFIPGGALITQALDNHGVFDRVGGWVDQQIRTLGMTGSVIRDAINQFLDSLSWSDIFDLGGVWNRARRIFSEPIDRIIAFVGGLVSGILQFIKDAILMPLARLASQTRGWDLLCAVLGRNPITGEAVPRNAETLIGGFMKLIGQEEVWQNIQRGNAVARAWAWFQGALAGVMAFVQQIPALFLNALRSLEIADIVLVPRALSRVAGVFAGFAGQFFAWAGQQVMNLLQIIFEVVAPGAMVYIRRAAGAFRTIIQNPVGFIGNLVRAGVMGFRQFAGRFLTHLRTSLIGWITGAMSGANIHIPQAFTLSEIIKFILSVLGLTWQSIRGKLVRVIGETAVGALETGFDIVVTLVREGPAAAWQKIVEAAGNLRDMVMEQVMSFVQQNIVQAAITRLVTSLNPAGAFIQAIIATYNTIMFLVERLQQISRVVMAFIDSIAAIAAGSLGTAANRVEQTMAGMLTLVISFLARLVGLGNVARAVTNIINRVRQPIDRALDRVVTWIVATARRLGRLVAGVARGTVAAVIGWWRARKSFRDRSGQAHSLYFTGSGRTARLMMASEPRSIEDVLNDTSLQITNRDALRASLVAINRKIQERGENLGTPAQQEAFQREIDRDITALAQALSQYLQHDEALPVSVVTWGANGSRAGSVHAEPLTRNPGNTTGTSATGYREHATGFALVSRWDQPKAHTRHGGTVEVEKSRVSAAHLLHHELHGPYEAPWNIVLADQGLNNSMAPLERRAVGEKNRGVRIRYHVSVRYWNDTLPPAVAMTVEEAEVEQVQSWIGYYIARTITVAAHAFESGSYSRQIVSQSVPGNLTPVRGQVTPTLDDQIITALRQRVSGPPVVIDGQQYGNTGITSSRDIATEVVHVQYPPVNSAVQRLIAAGRLSKASPRGPFLVKL